jgi:hypothetical protein
MLPISVRTDIRDERRLHPVLGLVDVADFGGREIRDVEALIDAADEETLSLEFARGLANRSAADAEALRPMDFVQPIAGPQVARGDQPDQPVAHRTGETCRDQFA